MSKRVTGQDVQDMLEQLREVGLDLDVEGAEYWQVENPFGPGGLHLLEVRPHEGRTVSQNTKLGTHRWSGPKEAHEALRLLWLGMSAARRAVSSADATARRENEALATTP